MNDWAIVTVVTRSHLHFARALAGSVRNVYPHARIYVFILDLDGHVPDRSLDQFEILGFESLELPRGRRFLFQYDAFTSLAAIRSYLLTFIFKTTELQRLLYFDADIQVYSRFDALLESLQQHNLILTPHLTRPSRIDGVDHWEMDVLDTGVFNIGFLGVRRSEQSLSMLRWWSGRVEKLCTRANHYEQGWLNAVPALFDRVLIERGSQYNVATWNIRTRHFEEGQGGEVLVDGVPLCFFHFAALEMDGNGRLSRVARTWLTEEPEAVRKLHRQYITRLEECGMTKCRLQRYQFSHLKDGTFISPEWRELIRMDHSAFLNVEDPFSIPAGTFRRAAIGQRLNRHFRRGLRGLGFKAK